MKQKPKKLNTGITLVALVITVIILLILAGISIATLTGSGLFENARLSEQKSKNAQEKEESILSDYENKIGEYVDSSRDTVTISKTEYEELINKFEKVEVISTTKLCYGNTTLNHDFSKYKILRCYISAGSTKMILEIDVNELVGSIVGTSSDSNINTNVCQMSINSDKSTLTLDKLGWTDSSTYYNRIASDGVTRYYVYKVEGIW